MFRNVRNGFEPATADTDASDRGVSQRALDRLDDRDGTSTGLDFQQLKAEPLYEAVRCLRPKAPIVDLSQMNFSHISRSLGAFSWRIIRFGAIASVLAVSCLVAFLYLPVARDLRVGVFTDLLSDRLQHPVVIEGDVALSFLPDIALVATDLRLPSKNLENVDVALLKKARVALDPLGTLMGKIPFPEIEASGLTVLLLRDASGVTSWITPTKTTDDAQSGGMVAFLGTRRIAISDMRLRALNQETGFEFDFVLKAFEVKQISGSTPAMEVTANGLVNEQSFEITGGFPFDDAFAVNGRVGASVFELKGTRFAEGALTDFDALLKIQAPDLQDVLDTMRLRGELVGRGEASAVLRLRNDVLDIEDINVTTSLEKGEEFTLTGHFKEQRLGNKFDLRFGFKRFPDGNEPRDALFLEDVQLTGVDLHVIGDSGTIEVESIVVDTNAFDEELRSIGPFRVDDLRRTEDGRLQLSGVTLSLGPPEAPFMRLTGDVDDLLAFEGYSLSGILDLPAERVLLTLRPEVSKEFGRLTGTLDLSEVEGRAELQELIVTSEDNDLWAGSLTASVKDLTSLEGVSLELRIGAADASTFLSALRLQPIDLGPFEVFLNTERRRTSLMTESRVQFGGSSVDMDIDARVLQSAPTVRGSVRSERIRITDLQNVVRIAVELARAPDVWRDLREAQAASRTETQPDFKPLVVTPEETDDQVTLSDFKPLVVDATPPPDTDVSEFKPLVVEATADQTDGLDDFKPLVVTDGAGDLSIEIFRDPERLLEVLDARIALDIAQLTGQAGISKIRSDLIMQDGKLDFGPLSLSYGGGFITLHAGLDVIRAPDWLRIKGRTSGWDIGKILPSLGVGIGVAGTLAAQFDLTGRHDPISAYFDTMRGQATLEMADGRIDSSLIELSGLGVVPWLFSRELQRGWARIVCLRAPLSMTSGRIGIKDAVLETDRVQLVANGIVDIPGDKLHVRADPRPVGQPLARSAWPIAISGSLSNPNAGIAERKSWRMLQPLAMPQNRRPCVPDAAQLQPVQSGPQ